MTIESDNESMVGHDGSAVSSTGAQTLGAVVLAAEVRGARTALRYKRDGEVVEMSYRELTQRARRVAGGLLALGIEPQRPGLDPLRHAPGMDARRLRRVVRRRRGGADLPHELAAGMRSTSSRTPTAALVFCENAAQAKKVADVRDACPALEHIVLLEGEAPGAMRLDELLRSGDAIADEAMEERVRTIDPPRPRDTRLHLRHHRPAEGLHAHPRELHRSHARCTRSASISRTRRVHVPPAGPRARPSHPDRRHRRRRDDRVLERRSQEDRRRSRRVCPDAFPVRAARATRRSTPRPRPAERAGPLKKRDFPLGGGAAVAGRARCNTGASGRRLVAPRMRWRTGSCCPRCAALFGGRLRLALGGAAPIAPEVLEFFDACGVPCSRATA